MRIFRYSGDQFNRTIKYEASFRVKTRANFRSNFSIVISGKFSDKTLILFPGPPEALSMFNYPSPRPPTPLFMYWGLDSLLFWRLTDWLTADLPSRLHFVWSARLFGCEALRAAYPVILSYTLSCLKSSLTLIEASISTRYGSAAVELLPEFKYAVVLRTVFAHTRIKWVGSCLKIRAMWQLLRPLPTSNS